MPPLTFFGQAAPPPAAAAPPVQGKVAVQGQEHDAQCNIPTLEIVTAVMKKKLQRCCAQGIIPECNNKGQCWQGSIERLNAMRIAMSGCRLFVKATMKKRRRRCCARGGMIPPISNNEGQCGQDSIKCIAMPPRRVQGEADVEYFNESRKVGKKLTLN
jgi:hypothetical protein